MTVQTLTRNRPSEVMPGSPQEPMALLLKPEEAAKLLKLGRTTIFALVKQKRLKAVKVGNLRRFRLSDLQEFVDQLTEGGMEHAA